MGKKKRGHPDVEEVLARPWCYYCERDFDDLKILISHQKAKHFKCERCGRRLNTAGGLSVHMNQVHKEALTAVENALPNRAGLEVEIFGMEGIPEDVTATHNQRVLQQFYEAEADRRAATGNPAPGGGSNAAPKKPKFESPSDLKKRLAEHKAKKAAQEAAGGSSGDVTPISAGPGGQSPAPGRSPGPYPQAGSPHFMPHQPPLSGSQASPPQPAYAQPYGQPPFQQPGFQQPPYGQPQSSFSQQPPGHGAPGMPQYPPSNSPQFSPPAQQYNQSGAPPFQPPFQSGPPRQFGAGSPPLPFHQGPHQAPSPRSQLPPISGPGHQRQGSLPPAPGLPQRPSFGAPQVNAFQLQQMHQGHPAPSTPRQQGFTEHPGHGATDGNVPHGHGMHSQAPPPESVPAISVSVDDLISNAKEAKSAGTTTASGTDAATEKKAKKDKEKDKNTKLVYSDNEVSPEEKMAKLSRYAYTPVHIPETVLGPPEAAVTGVVIGPDDVPDRQD